MKKTIVLFFCVFALQLVNAQNVRFTKGTFDNGLSYPIAEYIGDEEAQKRLNENILEIVSVYQDQDYCISQHGYVQHNKFIQLNFYFNCIDMERSKTESHLFSLSSGEICSPSEMIADDQKKGFEDFFQKKVTDHFTTNGKNAPKELISELSLDDCDVNLLKKGLEISLSSYEDWPNGILLIPWNELSPYIKHLRTR